MTLARSVTVLVVEAGFKLNDNTSSRGVSAAAGGQLASLFF